MTQISFLGHDAAHRQIFRSGRWNDWVSLIIANLLVGMSYGWWQSKHNRHHANPNKVGADPDIALTAIAFTPERATRHRSRLMRWLVAHQGWYFFPILLLEGLSLHKDGISRIISRDKIQRRWVEISFITFRLAGFAALVFLVLPPEKAVAFLGAQLAVFGLYMGLLIRAQPHRHAAGIAQADAGPPAPPGPDEPQHQRRIADLGLHGWAELPDRAPPVPLHGATLTCIKRSRSFPRTAPPKVSRTPAPRSGSPTASSSAISTVSDYAARTPSSALWSLNAAPSDPVCRWLRPLKWNPSSPTYRPSHLDRCSPIRKRRTV
jgi:hypothetical protein